MKLDAIGVTSTNLVQTVTFYSLLGFEFPSFTEDQQHIEAITREGGVRFMIDSVSLATELIGESPRPANHAICAVACDTAEEVDTAVKKIAEAGFTVVKEPWDAFWGQRYAVVQDPDGYLVDVFADLSDGTGEVE